MTVDVASVLQMMVGHIPAQVLRTVVRLGIVDRLAERPRTVAELAELTGTHEESLLRLLRVATVMGLCDWTSDRRVTLTAEGELLRADVPGSLRNVALMYGSEQAWQAWGRLEYSVRTGNNAFQHLYGKPEFEYMISHPEHRDMFASAMAEGTAGVAPGIVAACELTGVRTLADIGGGNGMLLAAFLRANPDLRGVLFDTRDGLGGAADVLAEAGVADRCEVVAGDFFRSVPPGCDAYLLKSVVHDWDDDRARRLLTACREAMAPHSVLYLAELVMPTDPGELRAAPSLPMSDLTMLVCTGGRERTREQYAALLESAGLTLDAVTPCPPPSSFSMLRAVPTTKVPRTNPSVG